MSALNAIADRFRRLDLASLADMRPAFPPVAVELDRGEAVLVRVRKRGGRAALDGHGVRTVPENTVGSSILRPNAGEPETLAGVVKALFESTGTRPGRVSLVLPDNLAKISIVTLQQRPPTRKQLEEVLRFKLRRSVPFRLDDAVLSFQVLDAPGPDIPILVAVMMRSVVEQYESALEAAGARPGLVDLCTPSLMNLCRREIERRGADGSDVALLNAARTYFSLLIVRGGRIVFFRCKSYATGEEEHAAANGVMARELATSFSYYQEKLDGQELGSVLVRTVSKPFGEIAETFERLGAREVVPVDPGSVLGLGDGVRLDPSMAHRIAPGAGATAGRLLA